MPEQKLILRPGINRQLTRLLNEGGWSDGNLVRFKIGQAHKNNGWQKFSNTAFSGICRGMAAAVELNGQTWIGLGTNLRIYVQLGGAYFDITPVAKTVNPLANNPFTFTSGSPLVTVADTAHGQTAGTYAIFSGASAGAGLTIVGEYTITSITNANAYVITAAGNANASTTGGGAAVVVKYLIPPGEASAGTGFGWGVGTWGSSTWGTARSVALITLALRLWSVDHWGEDMVANYRGGGLYEWVAASGTSVRAVAITNSPTYNNWVLVGEPERHLISFGASASSTQDPMLIRWSDVEDLTVWTATATNSAGSFRLASGNKIQSALRTTSEILVWTDSAVYSMQFEGLPYVYTFHTLGKNCGLIAPHAAATLNGITVWMGLTNFHIYQGSVRQLTCDVWDDVFEDMNIVQKDKFHAVSIGAFNEFRFYYCSADSNEIDRYVAVQIENGQIYWNKGAHVRTSQIDADVYDYPLATSADSYLYYEEIGLDDDGQPMVGYIQSGYIDIADGSEFSIVKDIIPDFVLTGQVDMYVQGQDYPGGVVTTKGPYVVTPTTRWFTPRLRARQIAIRIEFNTLGADFRPGAIRANISPDGSR